MSETTALGTSWEEAVKNSYRRGYDHFDGIGYEEIKETMQGWAKEQDQNHAIHRAMNDPSIDAAIHGCQAHGELWWDIEDFFANHQSLERFERFQQEAAVAEDLDAAFEAGAYDALLGNESDVSEVSIFYE